MTKKILALFLVIWLGYTHVATAFNADGHKIVAEVAWRKLNASQRQGIVEMLRKHPRFTKDFQEKMPQEIANQGADAQNHWIFCQAAIWPDIFRGLSQSYQEKYHRARWHYVNLPIFLDEDQADAFNGNLTANVSFVLPSGGDEKMLNGVQAVKNSYNIVTHSNSTESQKAVHYCWLMHVIPDLAQPLHSAALFTTERFPAGDKGGNSIKVKRASESGGGSSLHSVWDAMLGRGGDFDDILQTANDIIQEHSAEFNASFAALPDDVWATESQALAVQAAYGALLAAIEDAEEEPGNLGVIEVPQSYFDEGRALSRKRAVTAGVRLAGVLASTIPASGGPTRFALGRAGLDFPAVIAMRRTDEPASEPENESADAMELKSTEDDRVEELMRRVDALTEEVSRLKALLGRDAVQQRPIRRASTLGARARAALAEDDGEQCDCGMHE